MMNTSPTPLAHPARLVALCLMSLILAAGCKSSPEIPEEAAVTAEKPTYRSTTEGEEEEKDPAAASGLIREDAEQEAPSDTLKATGNVAIVNNEPITAAQFDEEVGKLVQSGQLPPHVVSQLQGRQREQVKAQIVQSMVVRRLLEQQIEKNPVEVSQAQIDTRIKQMEEELSMASNGRVTSIEAMRKEMGLTEEALVKSIKQSIALEELVRDVYNYKEATEEDAREYYDGHLAEFKQPEQVRARHILIKVDDPNDESQWSKKKKEIDRIYKKAAEANADFAAIAEEYSEDSTSSRGGDLGYFPRNAMVPEFEEVAFGITDGAVSEPFRSPFGWHIVKREDYRAAGPMPFDLVKEQLTRQLTGLKFQQSLERYIAEIQQTAEIEMKLENIT